MKEEQIVFEHVKKKYNQKVIIEDFNLIIEKGSFVTVIGTSGCGKTTILKMINGLVCADEGTIMIEGKDIRNEDLIALRRNIGYAIQGNGLFPHLTVEENIAYVPNLLNRKNKEKTESAIQHWLQIVGLQDDIRKRYPDELSGGQQQRVGIARAFAASPPIVLMDEPFGAVDGITRRQLQEELLRIHKETKITIVFVTHDIQEALLLGSKVLIMDQGQIIQYGTPENIIKHPANIFVEDLLGLKKAKK